MELQQEKNAFKAKFDEIIEAKEDVTRTLLWFYDDFCFELHIRAKNQNFKFAFSSLLYKEEKIYSNFPSKLYCSTISNILIHHGKTKYYPREVEELTGKKIVGNLLDAESSINEVIDYCFEFTDSLKNGQIFK